MQKAVPPEPEPPQPNPTGRRPLLLLFPVAAFAVLAAVFAYALGNGDPTKLPSTLIGRPVPATSFGPLEGFPATDARYQGFDRARLADGRVKVVNYWASWCAPCIEEHPVLVALASRTGVPIYGVNYKDKAPAARRFLDRYTNPFTAIGVDNSGRAAIEWGVYGMPETFVIDGQGRIAYKHVGPLTLDALSTKLIPALVSAGHRPAPG